MKANEAPEKIYLYTEGHTLDNDWLYEASEEFESFEYTHTDAFIEKACEWLEKSITNNAECNRIISRNGAITMGMLIEDFKQYMKGE